MSTPEAEDYLKAIYNLCSGDDAASTSSIASRLGVAAPSVTGMLKRLSDRGLVEHVPYYGARLTSDGEEAAIRMIRRHRILELFLVQVLGYTWDRVHDEAERMEHAVTDEMIERMAHVLGGPEADPHGAPIPTAGGAFEDRSFPSLAELDPGGTAILRRVSDEDAEALRYLAELRLLPGAEVHVIERMPFNGPLRIEVAGAETFIGVELARTLQVEAVEGEDDE